MNEKLKPLISAINTHLYKSKYKYKDIDNAYISLVSKVDWTYIHFIFIIEGVIFRYLGSGAKADTSEIVNNILYEEIIDLIMSDTIHNILSNPIKSLKSYRVKIL